VEPKEQPPAEKPDDQPPDDAGEKPPAPSDKPAAATTNRAAGAKDEPPADPGPKVRVSGVAKKGLAGSDPAHAAAVGAAWFYNWGLDGPADAKVEFVPMIKSAGQVRPDVLEALKGNPRLTHLLGFNEPEREDQGNTGVEEALNLWPQLMATGLRLGSPAPSSDKRGMDWLEAFMKGVEKRKLRVDFIAVHWYKDVTIPEAARTFEDWVRDLHKQYRRPVWVTEFAGMNWGFIRNPPLKMRDNVRFLEMAARTMERLDGIERYAWFVTGPDSPAALFAPGDPVKLSPLGETYRDAGP
jgi:hypothetical protein